MNKLLYPDPSNGIRIYFEDLEYILGLGSYDSGIINSIQDTLSIFGDDFIVTGCEDLGGSVTADGWIMLGGVLIRVKQHTRTNTYFSASTETNTDGDRVDILGSSINVFQQNRAEADSASGNLAYNGIRLDDILGRTSDTKAITTAGIHTLTDLERHVTVISSSLSATTINIPNAAEKNKGIIISLDINCIVTTGAITIQEVDTTNIKTLTTDSVYGYDEFILIKSDGTTWNIINETYNKKETELKTINTRYWIGGASGVGNLKNILDTLNDNLEYLFGKGVTTYTTQGTKNPDYTSSGIDVNIPSTSNPSTTIVLPEDDDDRMRPRVINVNVSQVGTSGNTFRIQSPSGVNLVNVSNPGSGTISGRAIFSYIGGGVWALLDTNIAFA